MREMKNNKKLEMLKKKGRLQNPFNLNLKWIIEYLKKGRYIKEM